MAAKSLSHGLSQSLAMVSSPMRMALCKVTVPCQASRHFSFSGILHDETLSTRNPEPSTEMAPSSTDTSVTTQELRTSPYSFSQVPFQCFQEARKILAEDRAEKLIQIRIERTRIARLQAQAGATVGGEDVKRLRLVRMQRHLQRLRMLAHINDPIIRKTFQDGEGEMKHSIYRYLSEEQWKSYKKKIIQQRIEQFNLIPDTIPAIESRYDVCVKFGRKEYAPGSFVPCQRSAPHPPTLDIQAFDNGERLLTVAIMDPDIPDADNDTFTSRCHFLAVNIPLSNLQKTIRLHALDSSAHIILPWIPPHSQKGAPYHRLPIFVFEQRPFKHVSAEAKTEDVVLQAAGNAPSTIPLDPTHLRQSMTSADSWTVDALLRAAQEAIQGQDGCRLHAVGLGLFRTIWDEGTDAVMEKYALPGAGVEFFINQPEKNIYRKKDGARFR